MFVGEIPRFHLRHLPEISNPQHDLLLSAQDVAHGAEAWLQRQTDLGEGNLSDPKMVQRL